MVVAEVAHEHLVSTVRSTPAVNAGRGSVVQDWMPRRIQHVPMARPFWPQQPVEQSAETRRLIEAALSADTSLVGLLRFVAVRNDGDGTWRALFARIDVCRAGDFALGPRFDYGDVRTLSQQVPGRAFGPILNALIDGTEPVLCDGVALCPLGPANRWDIERHSSSSGYADWPCLYLERAHNAATLHNVYGPLASASDAPYFSNVWDLVGHVADFGRFHGATDARKDMINLFIWDHTARLAKIVATPQGEMGLNIEGSDITDVVLRGQFVGGGDVEQIAQDAADEVTLKPTTTPDRVELALVHRDHGVVDRFEAPWQREPRQPTRGKESVESIVSWCLQQGECARVEFKPFVALHNQDTKWTEVFETAIAMANAQGGFVLLGVDDHAQPSFRAEDWKVVMGKGAEQLMATPHQERNAALETEIAKYASELRDRVEQHVNRSLMLRYTVTWVGGSPVLLLKVPKGSDPPYLDERNNKIWYRTNATNRHPSEEELATFFENRTR